MRVIAGAIVGGLTVLAQSNTVNADEPVVVELFTSQGCSSCPPADALLNELAQHDAVLPLALHVDYWDYIGWSDTFAAQAFTRRQKAYAAAGDRNMIFTPQMIVGGTLSVVGNRPVKVFSAIESIRERPVTVEMATRLDDGQLTVTVRPTDHDGDPASVIVVRYIPEAVVEIERGENSGRTIEYSNIVSEWRTIGEWDGEAEAQFQTEYSGDLNGAVLVQEAGFGAVLSAARLR